MKKWSKRFSLLCLILIWVLVAGTVNSSSTGWGWCTECGKDVNLSKHDFTHGRGVGSGYSRPRGPSIWQKMGHTGMKNSVKESWRLMGAKEYEKALVQFRKAQKQYWNNKGYSHLSWMVDIEYGIALAYNAWGVALAKQGKWTAALAQFEKAWNQLRRFRNRTNDFLYAEKSNYLDSYIRLSKQVEKNLAQARLRAAEERQMDAAKSRVTAVLDDLVDALGSSGSFAPAPAGGLTFMQPGTKFVPQAPPQTPVDASVVDLRHLGLDDKAVVDPRVVKGEMTPEEARKDRANEIMSGPGSNVNKEQDQYENRNKEWLSKQQDLIRQAVDSEKKRNKEMLSAISQARVPNLPPKSLNDLKPGDIILVKPDSSVISRGIPYGDVLSRWLHGSPNSQKYDISHSVVYLKTVNGKRLYLDHQMRNPINQEGDGFARIIDEDIFLKRYEKRLSYVARPKSPIDGKKLWAVARGAALKDNTPFGFFGKSVVCSELDRFAVVQASGKRLPLDSTRLLGPDITPSDFIDPETEGKYFVVTPLKK